LRNAHNLGQVPSLNRGLRESRGEYVARMDADDACLPKRLARQVEVLDSESRVCLVGAWMQAIDDRGRRIAQLQKRLDDYVDFIYHTLIMRVYVSHPAAMYRREPVLALGGYDEATGPAEDKDLWRKLALERYEARIVPETLVLYRIHDRQMSRTRAAYQRRVDSESQDRFLAQLAPDAPVTMARQLLAGEPEAWGHDAQTSVRAVEAVLAGASARLKLADDEARRLSERVALRLLEVANADPWNATARVVAAEAIARIPKQQRAAARLRRAAAFIRAPVGVVLRRLARLAADRAKGVPAIAGLRARSRRFRLARNLYGRIIGGNDD
jgi:glycosyl transferase family 2